MSAGSGQWVAQLDTASEFRPASRRFVSRDLGFVTTAASPILTPADPEWKSKPGSLEWASSTEAFNRNVGWTVGGWHWSVVGCGSVTGSGDEPTLDAAQKAAEDFLRTALGRKRSVIARVFGDAR